MRNAYSSDVIPDTIYSDIQKKYFIMIKVDGILLRERARCDYKSTLSSLLGK